MSSLSVLHIDDDPSFLQLASNYLDRVDPDIELLVETDVARAIAQIESELSRYDCIISDYEMGDKTGLDLLKIVRSVDSEFPFILYTGKGSEEIASKAISAGVTDYLQKSHGRETYTLLANRVRNAVQTYRAEQTRTALETRLETLTEATFDAVWERSYIDGELLWERGLRSLFGYTEQRHSEQPLSAWWRSNIHTEDRDRVDTQLQQVLDDSGERWECEYRFKRADGSYATVIDRGYLRVDGETQRLIGSIDDISALRAAEADAKQRHERMADGYLFVTDQWKITEINSKGSQLLNTPEKDIIGHDFWEQFPDAIGTLFESKYRHCMISGEHVEFNAYYPPFDSYYHVRCYSDQRGLSIYFQDVSKSVSQQQRLREERNLLEELFETSPIGIIVLDRDGQIIRSNSRAGDILGVSELGMAERAYNDSVWKIVDEEGNTISDEELPFHVARETGTSVFDYRHQVTRSDGTAVWISVNASPLFADDGSVTSVVVTIEDISGEKRYTSILNDLHESTRNMLRAKTVTDAVTEGILAGEQILGLEICGVFRYDPLTELLTPIITTDRAADVIGEYPQIPVSEGLAGRVYRTGKPEVHSDLRDVSARYNPETNIRSEVLFPLGEYGVFVAGSTTVNAFDETRVSLVQVFCSNLTAAIETHRQDEALKEKEATLKQQNDRLSEFASVVSHDLRNPLSVASGYLQLVRAEQDSPHLGRIETAIDRMDELIDDLLTLARTGEEIDTNETVLVKTVAEAAWENIERDDATLRFESGLKTIRGDPVRIQQLFENLFRNAIEHGAKSMPAEAPLVVTIGPLEDTMGFYVEDTGTGIPNEYRESVFEHGFSTNTDGTGFGLSIVTTIADAHGWTSTLAKSETGGARFEFRLPSTA